jgi:hypothetical protein
MIKMARLRMESLKYCVCMKRGYKIFYAICIAVSFICALCICVFGLPKCKSLGNYLSTLFTAGFFLVITILGCNEVTKKVQVYKGKIIYRRMLKTIEYKPSEVYSSKENYVETDYRDELGGWTTTYDKVTTFYDSNEKKLFKFGMAYENVQKLEKTVANNRKSIKNMKK